MARLALEKILAHEGFCVESAGTLQRGRELLDGQAVLRPGPAGRVRRGAAEADPDGKPPTDGGGHHGVRRLRRHERGAKPRARCPVPQAAGRLGDAQAPRASAITTHEQDTTRARHGPRAQGAHRRRAGRPLSPGHVGRARAGAAAIGGIPGRRRAGGGAAARSHALNVLLIQNGLSRLEGTVARQAHGEGGAGVEGGADVDLPAV